MGHRGGGSRWGATESMPHSTPLSHQRVLWRVQGQQAEEEAVVEPVPVEEGPIPVEEAEWTRNQVAQAAWNRLVAAGEDLDDHCDQMADLCETHMNAILMLRKDYTHDEKPHMIGTMGHWVIDRKQWPAISPQFLAVILLTWDARKVLDQWRLLCKGLAQAMVDGVRVRQLMALEQIYQQCMRWHKRTMPFEQKIGIWARLNNQLMIQTTLSPPSEDFVYGKDYECMGELESSDTWR